MSKKPSQTDEVVESAIREVAAASDHFTRGLLDSVITKLSEPDRSTLPAVAS